MEKTTTLHKIHIMRSYAELKSYYNDVLNKDRTTYTSSNDEPTPIECIEEMCSAIPVSVWKRSLRILDPCCGNGNFHVVVGEFLRNHGTYDRSCLHFNDVNPQRLHNVRSVFGDLHVTQKDFLTESFPSYSMIVLNPPYAKLLEDGSRASKNHNLSHAFLRKSLELLEPHGILMAIVPDNWMSLADRNTLIYELTQYQFHKISIHVAKKWFPKVGSSFTWFVLEKTPGTHTFAVDCLRGKTLLTDRVPSQRRHYIPLVYTRLIHSILSKTLDDETRPRIGLQTSSDLHRYTKKQWISATEDNDHPYRLIHTPKQTVWASRPHKWQEGWKVFLSTTDTYTAFVDNCGMTQSIAFVRCASKEDAETLRDRLLHPLYRFLNDICRYGNFNNIRVMQKFPKPTTTDCFHEFGLTAEEQQFVLGL